MAISLVGPLAFTFQVLVSPPVTQHT